MTPTQRLAGSRIREKRLDCGLRQAAVAETVGISPSYLNLIEHNRRRIGGKLLADLARALDVDISLLAEGADTEMLDQMRHAAASITSQVEVDRTEEIAARFPGWSALIATQARRIAALEEKNQALTDRLAHDPELAGSLHEVISAVSAIRSAASILVSPEELDPDWQRRFHENIHSDSVRLADSSEALITYLEAPEAVLEQSASPFEQAEDYLAATGFHLEPLESGADPDAIVQNAQLGEAATAVLRSIAKRYARDAMSLPLAAFEQACKETAYEPATLAQMFDVSFSTVLRRMAQLPSGKGHPPIGLVIGDAAGALTFVKSVPGFSMPRAGGACPLWPLFGVFSRPLQPLSLHVEMPAPNATRFLCYAIAEPTGHMAYDAPPALQSVMLVMPDPPERAQPPHPVGVSCRICARHACSSRREPALRGISALSVL